MIPIVAWRVRLSKRKVYEASSQLLVEFTTSTSRRPILTRASFSTSNMAKGNARVPDADQYYPLNTIPIGTPYSEVIYPVQMLSNLNVHQIDRRAFAQ